MFTIMKLLFKDMETRLRELEDFKKYLGNKPNRLVFKKFRCMK